MQVKHPRCRHERYWEELGVLGFPTLAFQLPSYRMLSLLFTYSSSNFHLRSFHLKHESYNTCVYLYAITSHPIDAMTPAYERLQAELMPRLNDAIGHCHPIRGPLTIAEWEAVIACEAALNEARRQLIHRVNDPYISIDNSVNDYNNNGTYWLKYLRLAFSVERPPLLQIQASAD